MTVSRVQISDDRPRVFVVDDDSVVLRALERAIRAAGYAVEAFDSPHTFLERAPQCEGLACVVLDLRLPGLSGLDLQHALMSSGRPMSIVFLSGSSDIPSVTSAMRRGAVDFLVKPVDELQLLDAIERALAHDREQRQVEQQQRDVDERLSRLTKREREVCMLVQRGLLNKQIAHELGTTEKTIKVHRGRMMHKLEVDSVAALVRLLSRQTTSAVGARVRKN
jgi:RNA polymerase sigma factor (sigma-70 family)